MQSRSLVLLAFAANAATVEVTPVQKVVTLLGAMLEKGKKEKQEEVVAFAAKTQFCGDTISDKKNTIEDSKQKISNLDAAIAKDVASVAQLSKQIANNIKDSDTWSGDVKAATKVRAIEKADFDKIHSDYGESIGALGNAIKALKAKTADHAQASGSLMQVSSLHALSLIPDSAKKAIDAFVQQEQVVSDIEDAAPEANAYEFQSSGIVDMLQKLQDKFVDERTSLQKEEANSKHANAMLLQNLNAQVKEAKKDTSDKTVTKASKTQHKAATTSDVNEERKLETSDTRYLKDLTTSCATAKTEFEGRQRMRGDEIVAIEKAIEIIKSGSVACNAAKHLPALLQSKKSSSLGQLRANANTQIQDRVSEYLHAQAAKFNSRILETVAVHASADPMTKVKKMIKNLIVKLMEEANAEADHKGFCDTELATNKATRTEKTNQVQTLNAEIDQLGASISKLTGDVSTLTKAVTGLDAAMAKQTAMRTADKTKNVETIADAQDAQTAVAQALVVLKEFYAKAGDAASASFLQESYTGMGCDGVVGMLEVIESDFARVEASTKADEASDQREYDTTMTESKVDKAGKNSAISHKQTKKQEAEANLGTKSNDLDSTQKELDAALNVFEKLKPSCVSSGVSYGDRVSRRKDEIESLKQAMQVMNSED